MDELYADRSGSIRKNSADPEVLSPPGGGFLIIEVDGLPGACGGFKLFDRACGEIKRMYVVPELRGRGLGLVLLNALEERLRSAGYTLARLDTGDRQPHARRLYLGAGYHEISDYNANPLAAYWFEKSL